MGNRSRIIITIIIVAFSFWFMWPTFVWYTQVDEADKALLQLSSEQLEAEFEAKGYTEDKLEEIKKLRELKQDIINPGLDLQGGILIQLKADFDSTGQKYSQAEKNAIMDQIIFVIRNRIDKFGVSEPKITKLGNEFIEIELPGAKDPESINDVASSQGQLELKIVDDETIAAMKNSGELKMDEKGRIIEINENSSLIPSDSEVLWAYETDKYGNPYKTDAYVIKKKVMLDGQHIKNAQARPGTGSYDVVFSLDAEGSTIFADVTRNNVNKRLAIILDGKVQQAPNISEPITGGNASISGQNSIDDANTMAIILKSGSFPVPVVVAQQNQVGATLGGDSIKSGIMAGLIGAALVIIFMVIYYKLSGLVANVLIVFNIFFIIAFLAEFSYTITLPGIAGLILNIGMGVDAFVIIFERIKEVSKGQTKAGRTLSSDVAVSMGFDRAFWTIVDANITTLIAALALSLMGAGAIRGFAVTLSIGIVLNMIVVLITGKLIFTQLYNKKNKKLSI